MCVCVCVWSVGQFGGVSVQQVALLWVWDSWGSECATGGFVVGVGQLGE